MTAHDHAPLVANSPQEAAETMISEGSPLDSPSAHRMSEAETVTADFPRWSVQKDGLVAEFSFSSYLAGIEFVNRVADIAEEMNHHPEMSVGWRKVRLAIMTHSKKAITSLDTDFVRKVELMSAEMPTGLAVSPATT